MSTYTDYHKRYYKRHKEECLVRAKAYYYAHIDERRQYAQKYREQHKRTIPKAQEETKLREWGLR